MGAVTYIDDQRNHRTFSFELIEKHGKKSVNISPNGVIVVLYSLTGFPGLAHVINFNIY